jgi:hypothetical protein
MISGKFHGATKIVSALLKQFSRHRLENPSDTVRRICQSRIFTMSEKFAISESIYSEPLPTDYRLADFECRSFRDFRYELLAQFGSIIGEQRRFKAAAGNGYVSKARVFCARFTMGKLVAADHDSDQARDFGDSSSKEGLQVGKSGIEG